MQVLQEYIATHAVIILLVSAPSLIAVAFWSIVNPVLALTFVMIVACLARPFLQYLKRAHDPTEESVNGFI